MSEYQIFSNITDNIIFDS